MQSSVFSLPFQISIYHPILSNNCNSDFPPVLVLCSVFPGVVLEEEQDQLWKDRQIVLRVLRVDRQILRVDRGMDRRALRVDTWVLRVEKRVLRVGKRVLRVIRVVWQLRIIRRVLQVLRLAWQVLRKELPCNNVLFIGTI